MTQSMFPEIASQDFLDTSILTLDGTQSPPADVGGELIARMDNQAEAARFRAEPAAETRKAVGGEAIVLDDDVDDGLGELLALGGSAADAEAKLEADRAAGRERAKKRKKINQR